MTKGGSFPRGSRRHHITDVHLCIIDDDAINESGHQWSALGKRHIVEGRGHALAKRLASLGASRNVHVLLRLGIQVSPWLRYTMLGRGHLLSFPLALRPCEALCEGQSAPPSWLAFALRHDVTPRVPSCWEGVGEPGPPRRPCQGMGDEGRRSQHTAEVLPEQCVSGVRWSIARHAAGARAARNASVRP
jgi:hypothetical protein